MLLLLGGTSEKIDDVRTITNMSTGKLGATICNTLLADIPKQIKKIYYLCSSTSVQPQLNEKIKTIVIEGTFDLKEKVENLLNNTKVDFFIHSMAVSDYTTDYVSNVGRLSDELSNKLWSVKDTITKEELINLIHKVIECPEEKISTDKKISSTESDIIIKLKQTPKVISIIKEIQPKLILIGFKLLSDVTEDELIKVSTNLMKKNNCDYVVANDLSYIKKGTHNVIILNKDGIKIKVTGKEAIAHEIENIVKC